MDLRKLNLSVICLFNLNVTILSTLLLQNPFLTHYFCFVLKMVDIQLKDLGYTNKNASVASSVAEDLHSI